jgi:phenylacetate-CoA ligase
VTASRWLNRWWYGQVVYPLTVAVRGEAGVFRKLKEFERSQWLGRDEIQRRQAESLAAMLRYAVTRCPHYRQHAPLIGDLTMTNAFEVLPRLPLLTKVDLQHHLRELSAEGFHGLVTRKTTGGSTGQAVTLLKDRKGLGCEMAASWRGYGWAGIRRGDRGARWWGRGHSARRRWRSATADRVMNRRTFSAFAFTEQDLESYWRVCLRAKPAFFYGYTSMLEAFARFVDSRGYDGRSLGLTVIVSTSEVLSPQVRALLRSTFGCAVQNEYGCGEVGPIAYECEQGSLHIAAENLIVEILREDGTPAPVGESGEIVVTDLNNFAMPLLRYRLGDFGELSSQCPCSRGLPVIGRVRGRAYDIVSTPRGRRYHGEFFMYLFEDLRTAGVGVDQFQVVQRSEEDLEVRIVNRGALSAEQRSMITDRLREPLDGMTITIVEVPHIERERSGKLRLIVNQQRPTADQESVST